MCVCVGVCVFFLFFFLVFLVVGSALLVCTKFGQKLSNVRQVNTLVCVFLIYTFVMRRPILCYYYGGPQSIGPNVVSKNG